MLPTYLAISHFRTATALFAASAALSVLQGLGGGPMTLWILSGGHNHGRKCAAEQKLKSLDTAVPGSRCP
jgi:hypothetical protein